MLSLWLYADMNAAIKLNSSSAELVTICRAEMKENSRTAKLTLSPDEVEVNVNLWNDFKITLKSLPPQRCDMKTILYEEQASGWHYFSVFPHTHTYTVAIYIWSLVIILVLSCVHIHILV